MLSLAARGALLMILITENIWLRHQVSEKAKIVNCPNNKKHNNNNSDQFLTCDCRR